MCRLVVLKDLVTSFKIASVKNNKECKQVWVLLNRRQIAKEFYQYA